MQSEIKASARSGRKDLVSDVFAIADVKSAFCPAPRLADLHDLLRSPSEEFWRHVGGCVHCARAIAAVKPRLGAGPAAGGSVRARRAYEEAGRELARNHVYAFLRATAEQAGGGQGKGADVVIKEVLPWARQRDRKNHLLARLCLRREAEIVSGLAHHSIVSVTDQGEWQRSGEPFYVTRYVRGETLDAAVRRDASGLFGKLLGFLDVADAIAHAHERGVMHRNISPSNIMITGGSSVILGWSAAKYWRPKAWEDALFDAADLAGVRPNRAAAREPEFAAPERSSPWHDHRVDIFSLGATLKFIVSGGSQLSSGVGLTPPSVARYAPRLNAIVGQAMAFKPDDRYASVHEFTFSLRKLLSQDWVVPQ